MTAVTEMKPRDSTDLFADIVAGDANQVQDGVHIPSVVNGILLSQDGHFQHLRPDKTDVTPATLSHNFVA